jgi:hypothetical protein
MPMPKDLCEARPLKQEGSIFEVLELPEIWFERPTESNREN